MDVSKIMGEETMKISIFKSKNHYGDYTGQLDFGDNQILIITSKQNERNRLVKEVKSLIKNEGKKL